MKMLHYKMLGYTEVYNETTGELERKDMPCEVTAYWSESAEEIAKREAVNGEYTIEDDGVEEVATQLDRVEAQVAYTAMMTDTLLEV